MKDYYNFMNNNYAIVINVTYFFNSGYYSFEKINLN